ncbi:hypothetical protein RW1_049_00270 [Rhodococcus wratislaviensis NBRC 100605]|uniref:Uncharacterized protein n=1 Tax=Rhodococcus wratislaviensis NBRC 100605 TaxID=1219028 RepID=X0PXK6_RHOWR|nr:hypothetical protein RW1_049_00270 [Rhodococcus wratislaviensis NBRC 100605]
MPVRRWPARLTQSRYRISSGKDILTPITQCYSGFVDITEAFRSAAADVATPLLKPSGTFRPHRTEDCQVRHLAPTMSCRAAKLRHEFERGAQRNEFARGQPDPFRIRGLGLA